MYSPTAARVRANNDSQRTWAYLLNRGADVQPNPNRPIYTFHTPSFSQNRTDSKVHNAIDVTTPYIIRRNGGGAHFHAISTEGIQMDDYGVHVFTVEVKNHANTAHMFCGIVPTATLANGAGSTYPGHGGTIGSTLYLANGKLYANGLGDGGGEKLVPADGGMRPKFVSTVVTLTPNVKKIHWVVDGFVTKQVDITFNDQVFYFYLNMYDNNQEFEVVAPERLVTLNNFLPFDLATALRNELVEIPRDQIGLCKEAIRPGFHRSLKDKLGRKNVICLMVGCADAGKSTVFNAKMSICSGDYMRIRSVGAASVAGAQHSVNNLRQNCTPFLENTGFDAGNNAIVTWIEGDHGKLSILDSVGYKGDQREFLAHCYGKMENEEDYDRNDVSKQDAITNRLWSVGRRVSSIVVCVSAHHIKNPNPHQDEYVKKILEGARQWVKKDPTVPASPLYEIPVIVAITRCDELATNPDITDLLRQKYSPRLAGIFTECTRRFGVAPDHMVALGWLDQGDEIDWSHDTCDPRALAVKHLIFTAAEAGKIRLIRGA